MSTTIRKVTATAVLVGTAAIGVAVGTATSDHAGRFGTNVSKPDSTVQVDYREQRPKPGFVTYTRPTVAPRYDGRF